MPEHPPVPAPRAPTVSVAARVCVPWPLVVLVKVTVASCIPAESVSACEFTVNVTIDPVDAVPEVAEGVSQFGTPDIEKPALPLGEFSV